MITVENSVEINRSPDEVFAFVTDATNDPKWHTDILEAGRLSDGPAGNGARYRWVLKFMGKKNTEVETTAYQPNTSAQLRMVKGPVHPTITYRFESTAGGTRFTRRVDLEPAGMFKLMAPMMRSMMRRGNAKFVENLRGVLER
jgi:uncharacterized protein YndB with AHSA1/START domain